VKLLVRGVVGGEEVCSRSGEGCCDGNQALAFGRCECGCRVLTNCSERDVSQFHGKAVPDRVWPGWADQGLFSVPWSALEEVKEVRSVTAQRLAVIFLGGIVNDRQLGDVLPGICGDRDFPAGRRLPT